jgi:hypothetical protein
MALPVSIGDAILLSQLAYRLGHTITVGRKQASAGIREVQSQLYSLGKALDSIALSANPTASSRSSGDVETDKDVSCEDDQALTEVIANCHRMLHEVEAFTDKFDTQSTGPESITPEDTENRRWRNNLRANWKKVRWTMEGTKLDELRNNLQMHLMALSLFLDGQTRCVSQ